MNNVYVDVVQVGLGMLIIIGIGWVLANSKIISPQMFSSANKFTSKLCLPMLMFTTLCKNKIREISFTPLFITLLMNISCHIILCLVFLFGFSKPLELFVTLEISSCYVNYIVIGLPIFTSIWGESSSQVAVVCPFSHFLFLVPLFMLLTELVKISNTEDPLSRKKITLKDVWNALLTSLKTPLLVGAFIGLAWSCTGLKPPIFVEKLSKIMGDVVVVFSLLCIGSFLENNSVFACDWRILVTCLAMRFFIAPLTTIGWCHLLRIDNLLSKQCTILTSMPLSTVAYLLATTTGFGIGSSSSVVFWSVILVVPIIMMWFFLLDYFNVYE